MRACRDADPPAVTLLVDVGVESLPGESIGQRGQCAAPMDQGDITEDSNVDIVHRKVFERRWARIGDVVQVFGPVARDALELDDKVIGKEVAEALDIAGLIGVDVVEIELSQDREILGGLRGVVHCLPVSSVRLGFRPGCAVVQFVEHSASVSVATSALRRPVSGAGYAGAVPMLSNVGPSSSRLRDYLVHIRPSRQWLARALVSLRRSADSGVVDETESLAYSTVVFRDPDNIQLELIATP